MTEIPGKDTYIKEIFSKTLEQLLKKKELEDISASEIIEQSGLSRSTFYRHFTDKYELANWKYKEMLGRLSRDHTSPDTSGKNLRSLVDFIYSNRDYFKKVIAYTGQNSFYEYYLSVSVEWAEQIQKKAGRKLTRKDIYTLRYHSAGIVDILQEWLQSDDPLPPEAFFEIIRDNRSELIKALYTDPT